MDDLAWLDVPARRSSINPDESVSRVPYSHFEGRVRDDSIHVDVAIDLIKALFVNEDSEYRDSGATLL